MKDGAGTHLWGLMQEPGSVEVPSTCWPTPGCGPRATLHPQRLRLLHLVVVDPGLLAFACCPQSSLGSSGDPGVDACSVLLVCRVLCPRLRSSLGPRWVDSCVGPRPGSFGEDGISLGRELVFAGAGSAGCWGRHLSPRALLQIRTDPCQIWGSSDLRVAQVTA